MNASFKAVLKLSFGGMSLTMLYLAITTSIKSDIFHLPAQVVNEPWFQITLVDFYFNITIISAWVIYKEKKLIAAIFWIIAFVLLGSIATAFYVFLQLLKLKENDKIDKIFLRQA